LLGFFGARGGGLANGALVASTDNMAAEDCSSLHIVLVHGTWGRGFFPSLTTHLLQHGHRWFEPESVFCRSLVQSLNDNKMILSIEPFLWSGSNSLAARDLAASKLATMLNLKPDQKHVIIAHSHGGNVAFQALSETQLKEAILVTLATPFIQISRRREIKYVEMLRRVLVVINLLVLVVSYVVATLVARILNQHLPVAIAAFLLVFVLGQYVRRGLANIAIRRNRPRSASGYGKSLALPMLVIRSPADEAYLALMLSAIGTQLTNLTLKLSDLFIRIGLPLLVLLLVSECTLVLYKSSPEVLQVVTFHLSIALISVPGILLVALLLGALFHAVNGRELFFGGFLNEIDVTNTPNSAAGVEVRTLKPNGRAPSSLRHSIYEHTECASVLIGPH
jgi:hypothetical protein